MPTKYNDFAFIQKKKVLIFVLIQRFGFFSSSYFLILLKKIVYFSFIFILVLKRIRALYEYNKKVAFFTHLGSWMSHSSILFNSLYYFKNIC
jgi:hypothetical protein